MRSLAGMASAVHGHRRLALDGMVGAGLHRTAAAHVLHDGVMLAPRPSNRVSAALQPQHLHVTCGPGRQARKRRWRALRRNAGAARTRPARRSRSPHRCPRPVDQPREGVNSR
jgi:hypothetical protein